jgi:alkylation response protein AidB-like acyl-CoA dehydrogenase
MEQRDHPSTYFPKELITQLRALSTTAEEKKQLSKEQLLIIYQYKWFKLFVPQTLNGLEYSLPEALRMEEALAWVDGSLGWTVTLCSGANWFIGFLKGERIKALFSSEKVCLAGSGRPSGIAYIKEDGYEVSGFWDYATGAPHATIFTAVCKIRKDNIALFNDDGTEKVKAFWFLRDEVEIQENWSSMGMKATASHSFKVDRLQLSHERAFELQQEKLQSDLAVYQYPFLQFAEATLAVNYIGMAFHFLDLSKEIYTSQKEQQKPDSHRQLQINKMQLAIHEGVLACEKERKLFYEVIQQSWELVEKKKILEENLLQRISESSKALAKTARTTVAAIYPYCGMAAASSGTEINRVWRDINTASQHPLLLS